MVATAAWNIFSGYSGYLALGHAVFFGSGGYAVALAARDWHFKGGWDVFGLLPFGGLVAAAIAVPFGLIALRTRRHTFVVVTIAIFFIFQLAAFNLGFTGGHLRDPAAVRAVLGCELQQALLLRRARDPDPHRDAVVGGSALAVRPAAAGNPRRREPRARARGQDEAGEAGRIRALGVPDRNGRRPVLLLPRPDLSPVRLRPAVRRVDRADGVPRRDRHARSGRCSARSCSRRCSST